MEKVQNWVWFTIIWCILIHWNYSFCTSRKLITDAYVDLKNATGVKYTSFQLDTLRDVLYFMKTTPGRLLGNKISAVSFVFHLNRHVFIASYSWGIPWKPHGWRTTMEGTRLRCNGTVCSYSYEHSSQSGVPHNWFVFSIRPHCLTAVCTIFRSNSICKTALLHSSLH